MKIPAIRAKIGTWTYYITALSFEQVSIHVEVINDQLHKSQGLRDMIQRSITDNYIKIKEYIQNQPEMFFNSLVLGVYDGMPKWIEVELSFGEEEFFNLGFLDFPGNEKIFPIDGQHRVEGIKAALIEDHSLKDNKIGAIFIGHSKSDEGMEKSRRLFTTLNRYAKPVTMDDIIALDEDDSVAIATRYLLENFSLFKEKRVTKSQNKAISDRDKDSITSIITLYQCNKELLKQFRIKRKTDSPNKERDKKSLEDYLKFRPNEVEVDLYIEYVIRFWQNFTDNLTSINEFNNSDIVNPAESFRNRDNGGNLLFRPVGLLPFVQAVIELKKRLNTDYSDILLKLNYLDFEMDNIPWRNVLWNHNERKMIMGTQVLTKLLIICMYDQNALRASEQQDLRIKLSAQLNIEIDESIRIINDLPLVSNRMIRRRTR